MNELTNSSTPLIVNQCCTLISTLIQKKNDLQHVHINRSEEDDEHFDQEFDEADEEVRCINNYLLHSTDSGSILIDDVNAAKKLFQTFKIQEQNDDLNDQLIGCEDTGEDTGDQRILFEENNICIEAEYNELKQRLVLRRVSGDSNAYTALCHQLINSII